MMSLYHPFFAFEQPRRRVVYQQPRMLHRPMQQPRRRVAYRQPRMLHHPAMQRQLHDPVTSMLACMDRDFGRDFFFGGDGGDRQAGDRPVVNRRDHSVVSHSVRKIRDADGRERYHETRRVNGAEQTLRYDTSEKDDEGHTVRHVETRMLGDGSGDADADSGDADADSKALAASEFDALWEASGFGRMSRRKQRRRRCRALRSNEAQSVSKRLKFDEDKAGKSKSGDEEKEENVDESMAELKLDNEMPRAKSPEDEGFVEDESDDDEEFVVVASQQQQPQKGLMEEVDDRED